MKSAMFAAMLLVVPTASAGDLSGPDEPYVLQPMTDEMLLMRHDGDLALETRLDADFNGDGLVDTAYVVRVPDEWRRLVVMIGYAEEVDMGHSPAGEAEMDPYPLGSAALSVKKGVLVVEDLAGGTSAISSTYRYRYDPKARRMRLIGDDVTYYSRTNNHDSIEISTNRLTGLQLRRVNKLTEDAYVPQPEVRGKVPTTPIYMEDAPDANVTVGLEE
jgi:hypothetical protein